MVCKEKGTSLALVLDILAPNVLLAQSIGRWGNFMNQEAHGGPVTRQFLENLYLPEFIIEQMNINGTYYHPTFIRVIVEFVGLCPHRHYTEPKTAFASRRSRFELRFVVLSGSVLH